NRAVQAAVFENGADTILRSGLPYDRCQIGVVTDLGGAIGLAEFDITEDDQMFKVLRTQVDAVLAGGAAVLNATLARVSEMKALCDGEVIFYSTDPNAAAITAHRGKNGRALFVRQDQVVLATGTTEAFLPGLGKLAAWTKWHERQGLSADTLLAAVGAAWALAIPLDLIGAGIEAFETFEKPAGRAD
ncbi:MAG: cyanophycin synthetase, partial [Polaromonas sp.]|nr:cyanophycin synthetase [Polaromonas sp.]